MSNSYIVYLGCGYYLGHYLEATQDSYKAWKFDELSILTALDYARETNKGAKIKMLR